MACTMYEFLNAHAMTLANRTYFCPMESHLKEYDKLKCLLQATGHDTTHLENALAIVRADLEILQKAAESAKSKFTVEGIKTGDASRMEEEVLQ